MTKPVGHLVSSPVPTSSAAASTSTPEPASAATRTVRGTQSFVYVMMWCWQRPSLTAIEIAWRWGFGLIALGLLYTQGRLLLAQATGGTLDPGRLGLDHLSFLDPAGSAARLAVAVATLTPLLSPVLGWLVPLLLTMWVVISAVGRTVLLRRADPSLHARPLTMVALQVVRAVALAAVLLLWFQILVWAAQTAIYRPLTAGGEPNLLLYFVVVILGTLLTFLVWALASWWLSIAPLLAMLENTGPLATLRASFRLGALTMKLVEINLVMGIVKVALVVLAMVFSATPLPFQSIATPDFLRNWWIAVSILYLLGSDFFHVVRLIACLRLWHAFRPAPRAQPASIAVPPPRL